MHENDDHREQLVQTWGSPWSPLEFVSQAAKAGHPSQLDACLPLRLKVLSQKFRMVPCLSVVATVFKGPSSGWTGWPR